MLLETFFFYIFMVLLLFRIEEARLYYEIRLPLCDGYEMRD